MQQAPIPRKTPRDLYEWQRAVRDAGISIQAKATALIIATYMSGKVLHCWPTQETLAAGCNVSLSSIKAHIRELDDAGYIERTGGGGRAKRTGAGIPVKYAATIPTTLNPAAGSRVQPPKTTPPKPSNPAAGKRVHGPNTRQPANPVPGSGLAPYPAAERLQSNQVSNHRSNQPPNPPQHWAEGTDLTASEVGSFDSLAQRLGAAMSQADREALNAEWPTCKHRAQMAREANRIAAVSNAAALIETLAASYTGARSVTAVMRDRLMTYGRAYSQPNPYLTQLTDNGDISGNGIPRPAEVQDHGDHRSAEISGDNPTGQHRDKTGTVDAALAMLASSLGKRQ